MIVSQVIPSFTSEKASTQRLTAVRAERDPGTADRADYLGTTYFGNGAVSAGWWKGPCQEFENGYGVIDLFDDGRCGASCPTFRWKSA